MPLRPETPLPKVRVSTRLIFMGRVSRAREHLMQAIIDLIWEQSYGSVTVDDICARAQVKKGSFYYFFKSKSELAVAALEYDWQNKRPTMDAFFSPTFPPLERLKQYFQSVYEHQRKLHQDTGQVLGCPLFTLGCEICTHETEIRAKVREIMFQYHRYLESAIREAVSTGQLRCSDPEARTHLVFATFEGTLAQARIQNNPELLRSLPDDILNLLGADPLLLAA